MEHIMGGGASLVIETVYGHHYPLSPNPQKAFSALHFLHCRKREEGGIKEGFRNRAKYV